MTDDRPMSDDDFTLPAWVIPGAKYRLHGTLYHVRAVVDGRAVLRYWRPAKQYWEYKVEHPSLYAVAAKHIERVS